MPRYHRVVVDFLVLAENKADAYRQVQDVTVPVWLESAIPDMEIGDPVPMSQDRWENTPVPT